MEARTMMPIPTHLMDCVVPDDPNVDESPLIGSVRCPCGGRTFELLFPGNTHERRGEFVPCTAEIGGRYFFLIQAVCRACGTNHLLLDVDFHGWNGFVCRNPQQAALPRPTLVPWKCVKCGDVSHTAVIDVRSEGKEFCVGEADGAIEDDQWHEAFGWFTISIECAGCGHSDKTWVSCETM